MKNNKKSPMTSFEELAQNYEGFDYQDALKRKELEDYKRSYKDKEEYETFKAKIKRIDEARREYYKWKNRSQYIENISNIYELRLKIKEIFKKYADKKYKLSKREEQEFDCTCFFNSIERPKNFLDIKNEVKVGLIAAEQELKEEIEKANIREYSAAIRIFKKLNKANIDDEIQSISSYARAASTKEEYKYAKIAARLEIAFENYAFKHVVSENYENRINWLNYNQHKYEKEIKYI